MRLQSVWVRDGGRARGFIKGSIERSPTAAAAAAAAFPAAASDGGGASRQNSSISAIAGNSSERGAQPLGVCCQTTTCQEWHLHRGGGGGGQRTAQGWGLRDGREGSGWVDGGLLTTTTGNVSRRQPAPRKGAVAKVGDGSEVGMCVLRGMAVVCVVGWCVDVGHGRLVFNGVLRKGLFPSDLKRGPKKRREGEEEEERRRR